MDFKFVLRLFLHDRETDFYPYHSTIITDFWILSRDFCNFFHILGDMGADVEFPLAF